MGDLFLQDHSWIWCILFHMAPNDYKGDGENAAVFQEEQEMCLLYSYSRPMRIYIILSKSS